MSRQKQRQRDLSRRLGYAGTHHELTQHLGNTVHVFHIGLPLIGGLVCAFFHYVGVVILLRMLFRLKHEPLTVLMLGQLLALCTMPVLMHKTGLLGRPLGE